MVSLRNMLWLTKQAVHKFVPVCEGEGKKIWGLHFY